MCNARPSRESIVTVPFLMFRPWEQGNSPLVYAEPIRSYGIVETPHNYSNFHREYDVIGLLGKGGFAEVFKVQHKASRQYRAAKIIPLDTVDSRTRFANEIRILQKLRSGYTANIVEYFEQPSVDGGPPMGIIVYDFIEGTDLLEFLNEHIQTNTRLSREILLAILQGMLRCLAHVHDHGVVHRDIKPENFIVSSDEGGTVRVNLIDFGLATEEGLSSTALHGTQAYTAPEAFGGSYVSKSDVWAVGLIFLTMNSHGNSLFQRIDSTDRNDRIVAESVIEELKSMHPMTVGLDILRNLLDPDMNSRPSASEALGHPIFAREVF